MKPGRVPACSPLPAAQRGFTLIELMLSLLVLGVLVAIAYPSFVDQMRKSRRADAVAALTAVQQAQERWRGNRGTYTSNLDSASPNGLGLATQSAAGYYAITITESLSTGYTVVATAAEGSSQQLDGNCKLMAVRAEGGNLKYGSGASSIGWTAPNPDAGNCWAR